MIVGSGASVLCFLFPMDLGHLGTVGERLAVPGSAGSVGLEHRRIADDHLDQSPAWLTAMVAQSSNPLNSENESPFGT
jgi:hypothetical protein